MENEIDTYVKVQRRTNKNNIYSESGKIELENKKLEPLIGKKVRIKIFLDDFV